MARQITEIMTNAFFRGETKSMSNTRVENKKMYLFGNLIAWVENGKLKINCCGWNSNTTLERLRGLGVDICKKKGELYLDGKQIKASGTYEVFDCE